MPFSNCIKLGHLMAIWSTRDVYKMTMRREDWCWRCCYIVAPERRNDQMFWICFFVFCNTCQCLTPTWCKLMFTAKAQSVLIRCAAALF